MQIPRTFGPFQRIGDHLRTRLSRSDATRAPAQSPRPRCSWGEEAFRTLPSPRHCLQRSQAGPDSLYSSHPVSNLASAPYLCPVEVLSAFGNDPSLDTSTNFVWFWDDLPSLPEIGSSFKGPWHHTIVHRHRLCREWEGRTHQCNYTLGK